MIELYRIQYNSICPRLRRVRTGDVMVRVRVNKHDTGKRRASFVHRVTVFRPESEVRHGS
jgi:hypothetical protein